MTVPDGSLVFPDRRDGDRFPVLGSTGAPVAWISTRLTSNAFTAADASGRPLCEASAGRWGLSRTWKALGPRGRPLLTVTFGWFRRSGAVSLARNSLDGNSLDGSGELTLDGGTWSRAFSVVDRGGNALLRATPRTSSFSFRQHDYAVETAAGGLELAEVVALVQIWRTVRRNESAAAAGGAAAAGAAAAGS